ncbi:cobalt-zinc-cadmium efflux system membrane fusion protein [Lacibacter cauensis]|uniref:Cobalt-zinc-cadmium efflux system membrane fusion protein n=1 Tax=Lacibacter cauensis TaxID=510947 RepID=A0A562SVI8_9BACT|nr:efflux RND transporter periplasmic adaptor subunit [Lacibacter cauensis]TWI85319.1 cobalt-zinc-cadmium efflux system membrane fusion protein [Lacibacter cauensis]
MKYAFILFSTALLLQACGGKTKTAEATTEQAVESLVTLTDAQLKNAALEITKLQQQQISSMLKLNGKIDVPPQNIVSISVPMGGYLKSTKLLPGLHVKKGEVIAVIEDQQYIQLQQDYLTAKAKLPFLENEYNRQKELNESKASSDKTYQQAEAEFRSQKVLTSALAEKLKLAGINLSRLDESNITRSIQIFSPIDGYVSAVNVNIGKYVAPTDVLFELINPTDIHLALTVFEKDVNKLFIGQKLVAYTNNDPSNKHECEILLIGKDLNDERNTEVHCHFEAYDKTLIPGTYMNAEVEVKNKAAWVVPEDAVVRFENKHYVFVKKSEKQFELTEVQTGISEKGFTEILNGDALQQKEIVGKGAYTVLMSLKNKTED